MNGSPIHARPKLAPSRVRAKRGTTLIELLAAFSLLITVLGVSLPLVVRHGRILLSADQYRLALDELTNQLERLRAMPAAAVADALKQLEPSDLTAGRLAGAKLEGKLETGDSGRRLRLQMYWDEPQRRGSPVELVGWLPPESTAAADATSAGRQP